MIDGCYCDTVSGFERCQYCIDEARNIAMRQEDNDVTEDRTFITIDTYTDEAPDVYIDDAYIGAMDSPETVTAVNTAINDKKKKHTIDTYPHMGPSTYYRAVTATTLNGDDFVTVYVDSENWRLFGKIDLIKCVRTYTGLGLREAKELVESEQRMIPLGHMSVDSARVVQFIMRKAFERVENPIFLYVQEF